MRISERECEAILAAIHAQDARAEVYLFGSRARDELKGGDIDLLVVSDVITFARKMDILVAIKARMGEQRIDLKVVNRSAVARDPFIQNILPGAVRLALPNELG